MVFWKFHGRVDCQQRSRAVIAHWPACRLQLQPKLTAACWWIVEVCRVCCLLVTSRVLSTQVNQWRE